MDNKGLKIAVWILLVSFVTMLICNTAFKDDFEYKKACRKNTKTAYENFIKEYPDSDKIPEARGKLESLKAAELQIKIANKYKEVKQENNLEAYMSFLALYPNSKYSDEVRQLAEHREDVIYQQLGRGYDSKLAYYYLDLVPNGKYADEIRQMRQKYEEEDYYKDAIKLACVDGYKNYLDNFPQGKHAKEIKKKLAALEDDDDYYEALKLKTASAYKDYLSKHASGKHCGEIKGKLDELEAYDKYKNNSLSHGSQPYAAYYGYNTSCSYYGCSQIKVQASSSSDVVVLIKKNNSNGNVVRHAYISAGRSYTFEIPDGTYQVFFYYGAGWYPNKKMSGGVKGGFLRNETFSKDYPQYLSGQILTYELIMQANGNFSTKPSSESEMF